MSSRERRRAKAWMVLHNIKNVDIKLALGMKYHTQVIETLTGVRDDQKVLKYLMDNGCPERYLDLPERMKGATI